MEEEILIGLGPSPIFSVGFVLVPVLSFRSFAKGISSSLSPSSEWSDESEDEELP